MSFNLCVIFLSLTVIVSAEISSEGNNTSLEDRNPTGCHCVQYDCGCCQHIKVKRVHLDDTVCANISYLPEDYGLSMTITFDSYTVFNTTISARNPPPICIGQDYVKELEAEICIRFYDLDVKEHRFHGCIKFEVELYKVKLASYDLGCFNLGPKSLKNTENFFKSKLGRFFSRNQVPQVVMI